MGESPVFVSVSEACDLLGRHEERRLARLGPRFKRGCSPRQLQYLDACDVLQATRANDRPQYARLYTAVDVMLLRLWIRLQAAGLSDSRARAALVYLADDLRRELDRPTSDRALLVTTGGRGLIVPAAGDYDGAIFAVVKLADVMTSTRAAVARVRAADPEVWSGRRFESCSSLAMAVAE